MRQGTTHPSFKIPAQHLEKESNHNEEILVQGSQRSIDEDSRDSEQIDDINGESQLNSDSQIPQQNVHGHNLLYLPIKSRPSETILTQKVLMHFNTHPLSNTHKLLSIPYHQQCRHHTNTAIYNYLHTMNLFLTLLSPSVQLTQLLGQC